MPSPEHQQVIARLNANWIWTPNWVDSSPLNTVGRLVTFVRHVTLPSGPDSAVVHCSADTRYKLYINGKRVAVGPSRGSPYLWFYDTLDISQFLLPGKNELRFVVLRYFAATRAAMPFGRTSFPGLTVFGTIECGSESFLLESANVGEWTAQVNEFVEFPSGLIDDGFLHISERTSPVASTETCIPLAYNFKTLNGDLLPWRLQQRMIPLPQEHTLRWKACNIGSSDIDSNDWILNLQKSTPVHFDADSLHKVDLIAETHSTAFIQLKIRSSRDTQVRLKLTYSEGYELEPRSYPFFRTKEDRLKAKGGHILGPYDEVVLQLPAEEDVSYEPFWFRTFRIIQFELHVGDAPVDLVAFTAMQTNYPLAVKANWRQVSDPLAEDMWKVSIRTMQNCMFDGYADCPFYEQLQYSMDSRAVGLFHYHISGDDRLMRQAITIFASSTTLEGLPQSRFPSHVNQLIAGFPLYWILEVCDHHLYFGDTVFARSFLPRIDGIFEFFDRHIGEKGLVHDLPADVWQFVDWVTTWHATEEHPDKGVPTSGRKNNCHTYFSMLLAYVLRQAALLARAVGRPGFSDEYEARANSLSTAVWKHCYDGSFFTDSTFEVADHLSYSQHCQIWAILSGAAPQSEHIRLVEKSFAKGNTKFSQCSYMMRFYALRAFALAGDDVYESQWDTTWQPWRQMLRNNLTTWEEDDVRQRSDCHAWGAVPIHEFCTELAGIKVIQPGAKKILFKPRLTLSDAIEATIAVGRENIANVIWVTDADSKAVNVSLKLTNALHVFSQMPGRPMLDHGIVDHLAFSWTDGP